MPLFVKVYILVFFSCAERCIYIYLYVYAPYNSPKQVPKCFLHPIRMDICNKQSPKKQYLYVYAPYNSPKQVPKCFLHPIRMDICNKQSPKKQCRISLTKYDMHLFFETFTARTINLGIQCIQSMNSFRVKTSFGIETILSKNNLLRVDSFWTHQHLNIFETPNYPFQLSIS